jgi:hypothetical protein
MKADRTCPCFQGICSEICCLRECSGAGCDGSGVKSVDAQAHPLSYAKQNGIAGGLMDYGIRGHASGYLNKNILYVTNDVGYDIGDFGNFLWGRRMAESGISLPMMQAGANYNNIVNGRRGTDYTSIYDLGPGTYGDPGLLDSTEDQTAIANGFWSSPKVIKTTQESMEEFNRVMNSWRPY